MRLALAVAMVSVGSSVAFAAPPAKAVDSVKLPAPAEKGDSQVFDVAGLVVRSDGQSVVFEAAIKADPAGIAGPALRVYWDTDNNAATGAKDRSSTHSGFEFASGVKVCADQGGGASTCLGKADKVAGYFAIADVEKLDGKTGTKSSVRAFHEAPRSPIQEKVVQGKVAYADIGVKSGQVIRLAIAVADGPFSDGAHFPDILLRLN